MLIISQISKLLGEENLNLRIENTKLKKNPKNWSFRKTYSDFLKKNKKIRLKSKLIFLKFITISRKAVLFFNSFYLTDLSGSLKKKDRSLNLIARKKVKKNFNLLKNIKKLDSIFLRFRNFFSKVTLFLYSAQLNFKKIKNFFKELLILDLITQFHIFSPTFSQKISNLSFQRLEFHSQKIFFKNIKKFRRKTSKKVKISLEFPKTFSGKKFLAKEIKKDPLYQFLLNQSVFFKNKDSKLKKKFFLNLAKIKNNLRNFFYSQEIFFQIKHFISRPVILFLLKIDKKIQIIKKKKETKLKKLKEKRCRLQILLKFSKIFKNLAQIKKDFFFRIFRLSCFNFENKKEKKKAVHRFCLTRKLENNKNSSGLLGPLAEKKKKISVKKKIRFFQFFKEEKKKLNKLLSELKPQFFKIFLQGELTLFRILDVKKELVCSNNNNFSQKINFFLHRKIPKIIQKEKIFLAIISSFKKRNFILKKKINEKNKIHKQVKSKLIEIKGMETDFVEIIKLIKTKKN